MDYGFFTDFLKNFRKKKGFGRIITYYNYSRICKIIVVSVKRAKIPGNTEEFTEKHRVRRKGGGKNYAVRSEILGRIES